MDSDPRPLQPERYQGGHAVSCGQHVLISRRQCWLPLKIPCQPPIACRFVRRQAFSYEQLQEWLLAGPFYALELERRGKSKASLLAQGINKQKRLMPQIISPTVTLSWREVYDIASTEFPDLYVCRPVKRVAVHGRSTCPASRRHPLKNARLEYVLKKGDHIPLPGTVTILLPQLGGLRQATHAHR